MIEVNGTRVKFAGEEDELAEEAAKVLYTVCARLFKTPEFKYLVLDEIYNSVKAAMERDDGIAGGGGSDA